MNETVQMIMIQWQGEQIALRCELEGMIAANSERIQKGESLAYPEKMFSELSDTIFRCNEDYIAKIQAMR